MAEICDGCGVQLKLRYAPQNPNLRYFSDRHPDAATGQGRYVWVEVGGESSVACPWTNTGEHAVEKYTAELARTAAMRTLAEKLSALPPGTWGEMTIEETKLTRFAVLMQLTSDTLSHEERETWLRQLDKLNRAILDAEGMGD